MIKDKLNVRLASHSNISSMRYENNHNLRTTKKTRNQINNNLCFLSYKGTDIKYTNQDPLVLKIRDEISNKLSNEETRHIELYNKHHKYKLREKRRRSFIGGVLTFPKKIEDIEIEKVWDLGKKAITEIAEHLDTTLHYITLHTDEKGLIHFQYSLNNFNNTNGRSLSIERTNRGEVLQDIAGKYFSEVNIYRGDKKKGRKHYSTEEYKAMQDDIHSEADKLETDLDTLSIEQLEDYKQKFKGHKLLKRLVDYVYRFKKLQEKEHNIKEKSKQIDRINSTLDKIAHGENISQEEATFIKSVFSSKALKGSLNKEAVKTIENTIRR